MDMVFGASVPFLNDADTHEGWKVSLTGTNAWVQFNAVDFGKDEWHSVKVRSASATGGTVEIRLDEANGPLLAQVELEKDPTWRGFSSKLVNAPKGIHDLVVIQEANSTVDLDWIRFE